MCPIDGEWVSASCWIWLYLIKASLGDYKADGGDEIRQKEFLLQSLRRNLQHQDPGFLLEIVGRGTELPRTREILLPLGTFLPSIYLICNSKMSLLFVNLCIMD
jgi:hypothetical protein